VALAEELADTVRPVALARERQLPVLPGLESLLPEAGLRRGSVVAAQGRGATSLALALAAGPSSSGSWTAAVGLPALGLRAAGELGVALHRLALVPDPDPATWATVVAALVDAFDVVLARPDRRARPSDGRRLTARARERGAVLVLLGPLGKWLEGPDLRLTVAGSAWEGLGDGHGHLRARRLTVEATGRRHASRPRRADLWLPGPSGGVHPVAVLEAAQAPAGAALSA
jgi:hypothetical protein